ncbi:MAG: PKD domain-containing protein, partial [Sphingobacteriales bacterium]
SSYAYSRTGSPTVITGFKFDNNGTTTAYAKYTIYANTSELDTMVTRKIYDSQSQANAQQSTINYYYNSAQHKLAQLKTTNSNGIIENMYAKYVKDYTVSLGSDSTVNALYRLQQLNINAPVETYTTMTRSGTTLTTASNLMKYKTFNPTGSGYLYLPVQTLKFVSVNGASFTPSSISGGVFVNDANYVPVQNDLAYDFTGFPLSVDDNNKHVRTLITDHISGSPVASVVNARYDEIGYNDFNSEITPVSFTTSSYTYSGNSRTGQYSLSLPASTAMSRTVNKNLLAGKYIFSIWINSATAGTLTISLTSGSNTNTDTVSYAAASGQWRYYEKKMSLTNMSTSFTAQFQSNVAILIDDVSFYPEVAEISTTAYDPVTFQPTARTNTNGVSNYFTYDSFSRPKLVYDQDKNILSRKAYHLNYGSSTNLSGLSILYSPGTINIGTTVSFSVSGIPDCFQDGVTAVWSFGDGSSNITALAPTHAYTSFGMKTVNVTLSSPLFATTTVTGFAIVSPALIPIYYTNNVSDPSKGNITSITFTGTSHTYTFTESDLHAGQSIYQDNYSVSMVIAPTHLPLWNSLNFNNGSDIACWPRSSGSSGTLSSVDLSTSSQLNLTLNTSNCSF